MRAERENLGQRKIMQHKTRYLKVAGMCDLGELAAIDVAVFHDGMVVPVQYCIRLTTGIKGDVHTSMQCIRPENPPNRTNTDNMDRCTHIDGTARPVKVGGKSTTPHPGKTGVKNLGTQHCGTHEDGKIWMALEEKRMLEVHTLFHSTTVLHTEPLSTTPTTHTATYTHHPNHSTHLACTQLLICLPPEISLSTEPRRHCTHLPDYFKWLCPVVAFHVLGQHKGAQVVLSQWPLAFPSSTFNQRFACLATIIDAHTACESDGYLTELAVPEYEKYGGRK
ncbi:hypothetical protein C8F01DRAFT_1236170 [Mycena amicta]|nr:hypothetical protein C8F01DRAFT_1236170 [Mycena amicta]